MENPQYLGVFFFVEALSVSYPQLSDVIEWAFNR